MSYILPLWSPPAEGEMWSVRKEVVCWPRSGWRGFGVDAAHIDSKTDVREELGGWESDSAGTTALTFELEAKLLNCAPRSGLITHILRIWLFFFLMGYTCRRQEEEGDTGWDGWVASLIQWYESWANSGRWWKTGKPGMLQSMGW